MKISLGLSHRNRRGKWTFDFKGRAEMMRDLVESPPLRGNVADHGERDGHANGDLDCVRTAAGRNTRRHNIDPSARISAAINAMPSAAPHFFEVKMKAPPRL